MLISDVIIHFCSTDSKIVQSLFQCSIFWNAKIPGYISPMYCQRYSLLKHRGPIYKQS